MKINKPKIFKFSKGDRVGIIDGSYMTTIIDGVHKRYGSKKIPSIGLNRDVWEVTKRNILNTKQITTDYRGKEVFNNIEIKNTTNGEIWYCSELNIDFVNEWERLIEWRVRTFNDRFTYT